MNILGATIAKQHHSVPLKLHLHNAEGTARTQLKQVFNAGITKNFLLQGLQRKTIILAL